jgi:ABC-2 type transport system ATP-binding protein
MFGFIGPNGAGKSTTIRFLATLLRATAGEGIVNGHSVTRDPIGGASFFLVEERTL